MSCINYLDLQDTTITRFISANVCHNNLKSFQFVSQFIFILSFPSNYDTFKPLRGGRGGGDTTISIYTLYSLFIFIFHLSMLKTKGIPNLDKKFSCVFKSLQRLIIRKHEDSTLFRPLIYHQRTEISINIPFRVDQNWLESKNLGKNIHTFGTPFSNFLGRCNTWVHIRGI